MLIIQGGMGIGISNWRLARTVSGLGQFGVVSGTAIEQVVARRLQMGDPGGHMRRALDAFPVPELAEAFWDGYYIPGGKAPRDAFKKVPMPEYPASFEWQALVMVANFVEVFLAREGHGNPVGINYLEKLQVPHLPSLYGAMLAGVDCVLMGAGIPMKIPGVLDRYANHEPATYPLATSGATADDPVMMSFDPREFVKLDLPPLKRPKFLAIVASDALALSLTRRANGKVDGFIIEGPTAGGHNAPPRGVLQLNERGEPVYGPRDVVDLEKVRAIGLPFWLAGGSATPEGVRDALAAGAAGVQVGTAFAMSKESGLRDDIKQSLMAKALAGTAEVVTNATASPTGFPFKVATLDSTLSNPDVYEARPRICDLGYLRTPFKEDDGSIGFRCPAEPVNLFVAKGGLKQSTEGRVCVCNALMATVGLPQMRARKLEEAPIITMGDDLTNIARFLAPGATEYSAADVIAELTAGLEARSPFAA